jgi:hypothetical protein
VKHRDGVELVMEPGPRDKRVAPAGMRVYMPLPLDRNLSVVGGPGAEFEVDGRNYDDNGGVQRMLVQKKLDEAGHWRVELAAAAQDYRHEFLVILVPWVDTRPEDLAVECAAAGTHHLCQIVRDGKRVSYRVNRDTGVIQR